MKPFIWITNYHFLLDHSHQHSQMLHFFITKKKLLGETTDQNCPPWPGLIVTTCMSYLTTGGPHKKHRTNNLPSTGIIQERSKEERRCQSLRPTNLPPSFSLESILAERCTRHQEGPWVRVTGQRQPGNQSNYHKTCACEPHGRAVLLSSLMLLLSALASLPNKVSCFVSTCISSDNSFPSVRQEPTLRPWKGPATKLLWT